MRKDCQERPSAAEAAVALTCTGLVRPVRLLGLLRGLQPARFRRPDTPVSQKFSPHVLRHSGITFAIAAGADPKIVQAMAGHRSIEETMETYGKLFPDRVEEVRQLMSEHRARSVRQFVATRYDLITAPEPVSEVRGILSQPVGQ